MFFAGNTPQNPTPKSDVLALKVGVNSPMVCSYVQSYVVSSPTSTMVAARPLARCREADGSGSHSGHAAAESSTGAEG